MSVFDELATIDTAMNVEAGTEVRLRSLSALAEWGTAACLRSLLQLGSEEEESPSILIAVGRALAKLDARGVSFSAWDSRDLTRSAYDAYCEPDE